MPSNCACSAAAFAGSRSRSASRKPRRRDIHALVTRARDAFDGLLGIPFDTVVASVVRWEGRPRASDGAAAP